MAKREKQGTLGDIADGPDRVLDNVTKILSEVRDQKNELIETEKLQIARGLERMLSNKPKPRQSYRKNGIELLLSHSDKLRVRRVDDGDGSANDGETEGDGE